MLYIFGHAKLFIIRAKVLSTTIRLFTVVSYVIKCYISMSHAESFNWLLTSEGLFSMLWGGATFF